MSRWRLAVAAVLLCLLLAGCTAERLPEGQTGVRVTLEETAGCTLEERSVVVEPGSRAVFHLKLEKGYALSQIDYPGKAYVSAEGDRMTLTLYGIAFPTRVKLELTRQYAQLTYEANGGQGAEGTSVTRTCDIRRRARPNTENGADLFYREGYTLESWNTAADGSGTRVGLGSRVSVPDGELTLYARWAGWSDENDFTWEDREDGAAITGYTGTDARVVLPQYLGGRPVTAVGAEAFAGCGAEELVLSPTLKTLEPGAFRDCQVRRLTLFDTLRDFDDSAFEGCAELETLFINAAEPPFGYRFHRESCYADKVDLLIQSRAENRVVFYGGCSTWYNLNGQLAQEELGGGWTVVNLGLNGTVVSNVQMDILGEYLHAGDILFHTPEISSTQQLLINTAMTKYDRRLWCGLEMNYDLFALVDLRRVPGVFGSLSVYLNSKKETCSYTDVFTDAKGEYFDQWGCVPFFRNETKEELADKVYLDPSYIDPEAMARLKEYYDAWQAKGVRVYLSCACINMDAVPEEQRGNLAQVDALFRESILAMDGPAVISRMEDYVFHQEDFFDTNYHLLTAAALRNTRMWLRDLTAQMERDGLRQGG